jgi:hypothetical protein
MQDTSSASASFREIDEHGNPLPHEPIPTEPDPAEARKFRINPFIVVLWVLNGALVVFVGWVMNASMGPTFYGNMPEVQASGPIFFVLMNSLPQILPLPFVTTTALLFWHAWQWQKRRTA